MPCHSQIETFQNIFHLLMKELVAEEHKEELSLLLRSVCSLVSQFGTIEEHFCHKILHNKPAAAIKDRKCVYTTDFNFIKLVESCNKTLREAIVVEAAQFLLKITHIF